MYKVVIPARVEKELKKIPAGDREKVIEALRELKSLPRPERAVILAKSVYRIRVGRYRVVYKVIESEKTIIIGMAIKRNEHTYKKLKALFSD